MAARVGLTPAMVIDAAEALLDDHGSLEAVTLAAVANRLGVRTQSLYAHVDGLDGLRRALTLRALAPLADAITASALGRSGADAVEAIALAHARFAMENPGRYEASLRAPGDDAELIAAADRVMAPMNLVLRAAGLDAVQARHHYRAIFSAVHGFAMLRRNGLFTLPGDPDATLRHIARLMADEVERDARPTVDARR